MIEFTKESLLDIEEIVLWYEDQRIGLSFDFELCLEAGVEEIIRNPKAFQKKYKNVKVLFIHRFPYGIHYLESKNNITVIGVFHTSRSPKNWSKRINL
ncbi:type II toxin-antitoxin system RelE/ParE family toxin [Flavobacterium sp. SUN052]|uniref:type II toxin-antitoxin system RelE/ParE family toxin n=1 Tax=Flavobacterium sp. SUN052 TaxID=3002441 RepID=UPI00237D7748|nr:type II toxin-antitoxin system RelE/ParE family toxin [Flavobacterium sp. SUN052]MEC4004151.1 type II toxin-antitoxin system RelE/ParE family toxin [Flavobacterium sp. SUN052]